jgi:hypothetical protein
MDEAIRQWLGFVAKGEASIAYLGIKIFIF